MHQVPFPATDQPLTLPGELFQQLNRPCMYLQEWDAILQWSLGWGYTSSSLLIPPDCLWTGSLSIIFYLLRKRYLLWNEPSDAANAELQYSLLPVFVDVLVWLMAVLGLHCIVSVVLALLDDDVLPGPVWLIASMGFVRWVTLEIIVDGLPILFLQKSVTARAWRRALLIAISFAICMASGSTLLYLNYGTAINSVPVTAAASFSAVMATLYFVIGATGCIGTRLRHRTLAMVLM